MVSEGGERRALGGVPREQKMLKGHLPRVMYHQVYEYTKINVLKTFEGVPSSLRRGLVRPLAGPQGVLARVGITAGCC